MSKFLNQLDLAEGFVRVMCVCILKIVYRHKTDYSVSPDSQKCQLIRITYILFVYKSMLL